MYKMPTEFQFYLAQALNQPQYKQCHVFVSCMDAKGLIPWNFYAFTSIDVC